MSRIKVFDPPMCCSTGVCGPSVDPKMTEFAANLEWLRSKGATVERYNLAQQPAAFAENPLVKAALQRSGNDCLPLTIVDETVLVMGCYPSRAQLAEAAGIDGAAAVSA